LAGAATTFGREKGTVRWHTLHGMRFRHTRSRPGSRLVGALLRAAAICAVVAAALFDVSIGTFSRPGTGTALTVSASVAAATLLGVPALAARDVRPWALTYASGVAAAASLACTVAIHLTAGDAAASDVYGAFDPSDAYGAFEPVALLILLAVTARQGAPVPAAVVTATLFAAVIARPLAVRVNENGLIVAFMLTLVAVTVIAVSLATRLVMADRRQREQRIRLEQRLALARELHDFVAHHVTGIVVQAQGIQAVAAKRPNMVAPALQRIEQTGAEALVSLRRMVGGLRAEDIDAPPAAPEGMRDLRDLVADFSLHDVSAQLTETGPTDTLPSDVAAVAHRVTMESLTNICKHAHGCRHVHVRVQALPQQAVVEVSNDGTVRQTSSPGYGLKGLEERVTRLGGTFRAGATTDGGWLVRACLPLTPAGTDAP
jgi:signal transduction histidine kinase